MTVLFYDIATAAQLAALQDVLKAIDVHLGYLAADGVTATPQQGRNAYMIAGIYPPDTPGIGLTTTWTSLRPHPVTAGRYALAVDRWVTLILAAEIARLQAIQSPTAPQTALLNALTSLPAPVSLDASWTPGG